MTLSDHPEPLTVGDFVELSYTVRVDDGSRIVDTTNPEVAGESDLADIEANGPTVVMLGADHLFDPVEEAILEQGVGTEDEVLVPPEAAFGVPDPTASATVDIEHVPAEQREVGSKVWYKGDSGFIESFDDESARLNFNHPLAGSTLVYEIEVHRRITDFEEKVSGILLAYELADSVEAAVEEDGETTVRLTATEPTAALDDWETRKSRVVDDLHEHLGVETVELVEIHTA